MSALLAFIHHVAAFTIFSALVVEWVFITGELTLRTARVIRFADLALGIASGVILIAGGLRVVYFEKGLEFYVSNTPFIAKMALFATVGILSIYPTIRFMGWGAKLKRGETPSLSASTRNAILTIIQLEFGALLALIAMAAVMVRGAGLLY